MATPPKWLRDPHELLEFYIQNLNVASVRKIIAQNNGICSSSKRGFHPLATLMYAGLGGYHGQDQISLVREIGLILINEGRANINQTDELGKTALCHAVITANIERCHFCLDNGADPSLAGSPEHTPLITALRRNQPLIALMLIKRGADVRVQVRQTETGERAPPANGALYYAMKLDMFLEGPNSSSSINMWLWGARYDIIEALLERGADPNQYFYDKTPQGYVRTKPLQVARDSVQPDIYCLLRAFKATAN